MSLALSNIASLFTATSSAITDVLSNKVGQQPNFAGTKSDADAAQDPSTSDTVILSAQAQAIVASKVAPSDNFYTQFFPTRDGSPATALATAVTDPGAESSSKGKTSAEVVDDARARLDKNYAALQASGKPFDFNSNEGKDWYSLYSDFDRRSLNAVANDQSGTFTDQERNIAQSILGQQQGLATGQYAGPTRLEGIYAAAQPLYAPNDLSPQHFAAQADAALKFLSGVSDDEKTTVSWAYSVAAATRQAQLSGSDAQTPDANNPLVKVISAALNSIGTNIARGTTHGSIRTVDDLKSQPWFQGFENQLDVAISQTQKLYQTTSVTA